MSMAESDDEGSLNLSFAFFEEVPQRLGGT